LPATTPATTAPATPALPKTTATTPAAPKAAPVAEATPATPAPEPAPATSAETTPPPAQAAAAPTPAPAVAPTPAPSSSAPAAPAPAAPVPAPAQAAATPAAASPVQVASIASPPPPEPDNWLLGKWQGPAFGCPPSGGVEFTGAKSFTYFKGKISATLPVSYRVGPDSVTVTTVGADGIAQDYVYQRTGPNSMIIVGIPPNMPRSLLGAAHRRCDIAPAAKNTPQALQAPVAVYPGSTPDLPTEPQQPAKPSTYVETPEPATPPVAAPVAPSAATATPEAEPAPEPAPAPEAATPETTAPALPKTTTPASAAEKTTQQAEEQQAVAPPPESSSSESTPAPETTAPETTTETTTETTPTPEPTAPEQQASATPPPASANNGEQQGWDALNAGNADQALQIWEPLAKAGNTGLAVNVADMYEFGQKLPQDYGKAVEWYQIAADQGDGYAQYQVGRAYTRGMGVPIDRVQAYKWLSLAMQTRSNAEAQGKTGKASKVEIETALNDIVGAMSQEEMTKAAQMVKQYNDQHHIEQ
jgi:hypothetical protein